MLNRNIVLLIMVLSLIAMVVIDYNIVGGLHKTVKELRSTVVQQDLEIQRIQNEFDQYKENYRYISDIVNR